MSLQDEYKKLIKSLPKTIGPDYDYARETAFADRWGLDVEWKNFKVNGRTVGAWNIDMGISINEFLKLNPDIQQRLITKFRDYPQIVQQLQNFSVSKKSILGLNSPVSVADLLLNELIEATSTSDPAAFIGHRIKKYGNASADFKNTRYRAAAMEGRLSTGANRFQLPEGGGIIHMPSASTTFPGTRDEYRQAAQYWRETFPDEKLKGFQKANGVYYENGQQMRVRNAGTELKPRIVVQSAKDVAKTTKDQIAAGITQAPSGAELVDITKLRETVPKGSAIHHKRMRGAFKPFFVNLDDAGTRELADYAASRWSPLGDVMDNLEIVEDLTHGAHHDYLKHDADLQMTNRQFPDFSGADLETRKKGIDTYFEFLQPGIDENLEFSKQAYKTLIDQGETPTRSAIRRLAKALAIGATAGTGITLATGLQSLARGVSAVPGMKALDILVAGWSQKDLEEAQRLYDEDPSADNEAYLNWARTMRNYDASSVVDPTGSVLPLGVSDVGGIQHAFKNPRHTEMWQGLDRHLGGIVSN